MMNSQRFQILVLVALFGFCAANGMYVIPYGFDSLYSPYSDTTPATSTSTRTTTVTGTNSTAPWPSSTTLRTTMASSTTGTPSTPVPSTTTVQPPPSSSHRICTKCMKKTSTTVPPTPTSTPTTTTTTTTTTTPKPTTTSTTTTTTRRTTTTPKPTTTKKTTTTTSTTTTTTTTTTKPPPTNPPPKKPEDAFSIKYYHQYNYYYPTESPTVTKPNKIKTSVYIKNVTKAVVPIAENVYLTETCDNNKWPRPTTTAAPVPKHHVPSYVSYVPTAYSHTAHVTADSDEQMYEYHQPEPAPPRWDGPRGCPHQSAPVNSIRRDIVAYLSDPHVLTHSHPEGFENIAYARYPPMVPPAYSTYNQFLEPGKSWLNCQQPSSAPVYSYTV